MNATHLTLNNARFAMSNDLTPAALFAVRESSLGTGDSAQSTNHSLFAQLRSQYPAGALTSELVQVHEGQFVVRALVQVGNATLATGMAAAEQIEVAEDRARIRAMEVLGIAPTVSSAYEVQAQRLVDPREPEFSAASLNALKDAKLPTFESQETEEIAPPKAIVGRTTETPERLAPGNSGSDDFLSTFPGLDLPEVVPAPIEADYDQGQEFEADLPEAAVYQALEETEGVKASVPDVTFSNDPIDLSDAIAQIGTEIERIGWTKKQGSTYLQQTYSKKTRAELTEDELLEFLHYLKALPSKGHPSLSQIPF